MKFYLSEGIDECTVIRCTFDKASDLPENSLRVFQFLPKNQSNTLIVFNEDKYESEGFINALYENFVSRLITIGRPWAGGYLDGIQLQQYVSAQAFADSFRRDDYFMENIMVVDHPEAKALLHLVEKKTRHTILEVSLDALAYNIGYFRSKLKPQTKLVALTKAFSYGAGAYEVACLMEHLGVDYMGVAATDEGIQLREAGISMPIIILTPEPENLEVLVQYELEPEIHNFRSLNSFVAMANKLQLSAYPIHIKIDSGMHRQGFEEKDIDELASILTSNPCVKVVSAFTHLAGSDEEKHDDFTRGQLALYDKLSTIIQNKIGYKVTRHALNSAGIERFPEGQFDMARLGIGLYGASDVSRQATKVVSTFRTVVTQIKEVAPPETVGYGRKGQLSQPTRIAVMPVGYADGLNRLLSNGNGSFCVNGQLAPIIGNICMDLCMMNITGLDVKEGDEVVIFGEKPSTFEMAQKLNTITYEVLTSIAARVKRVYTITDDVLFG